MRYLAGESPVVELVGLRPSLRQAGWGDLSGEGSRRQTSGLTNRNHIQAFPEDERAIERKVPYLLGIRSGKCGRYMEGKILCLPVEVSVATEVVATAKAEKSATVIVAQEYERRTKL